MKEKQNSLCLRPHHGMCLAYFEGRGYSREFAEHMGKILDIMERDARVSLTVGGDVICSACPNLKGQVCVTADQVAEYDRKVLLLCGLQENETISFAEFTEKVEKLILQPGKRKEICGNCQWDGICSSRKSRWIKE